MEQMLGVIGGMGPLASQLFYKLVTEQTQADTDQEHIRLLLLSDTDMPDRTAAILSGQTDPPRNRLLQDAQFLERSGCSAIAVTCNTAHFFLDMIAPELSIPILHMVRETAQEVSRRFPGGKVAILATDGTIQAGLYQRALGEHNLRFYIPSAPTQGLVMSEIYDYVKRGLPADMVMWEAIERELTSAGCDAALLACTELSCIRDQNHLSGYYIDPLEVLARHAIRFMGKRLRPDHEV